MDRLKKAFGDLESERSTSKRAVEQSASRQGSGRSLGNLVALAGENLKQEEEDATSLADDEQAHTDSKPEATSNKAEQQQGLEATKRLPPQSRRLDPEPSFNFLEVISAGRIANTSAAEAAASTAQRTAERKESDAYPPKQEGKQSRRRTTATKLPSSQSVLQGSSSTGTTHQHSSLLSVGDMFFHALELSNLESETVSPSDANFGPGINIADIPASLRSRFNRRGSHPDANQPSRTSAVQQLACIEPRRRRGSEVGDAVIYRRRSSADLGLRQSSSSSVSSSAVREEGSDEGRKDAKGDSKHSLAYSNNGSGDSSSHGQIGGDRGLLDSFTDSFSTLASIERQVAKRSHFRQSRRSM